MGNDIYPKLVSRTLYVTKGADRQVGLHRRDSAGVSVAWSASVYMDIDIDPASPTRVTATVLGDYAVIRIESTVCDQVVDGTRWRVIMSESGSPSLETPVMVGMFKRNDG